MILPFNALKRVYVCCVRGVVEGDLLQAAHDDSIDSHEAREAHNQSNMSLNGTVKPRSDLWKRVKGFVGYLLQKQSLALSGYIYI